MTESFELVRRITELEDALRVCDIPGWQLIVAEAEQRADDYTRQVIEARATRMPPEEVDQKRGQVRELRWLIDYEQTKRDELADAQRELRQNQDAAQL